MSLWTPTPERLRALWAASVEDGWARLLSPEVTLGRYEHQLGCAYGFESALEAALAYAPRRVELCEMRPRAGYLVEDLMALGMRPSRVAQLPTCPIELFTSVDEALGWICVAERGARFHEAVVRHLDARVPEATHACRYLRASAAGFETRHSLLASALNRCDPARVVDAARSAYERSASWYRIGPARAA